MTVRLGAASREGRDAPRAAGLLPGGGGRGRGSVCVHAAARDWAGHAEREGVPQWPQTITDNSASPPYAAAAAASAAARLAPASAEPHSTVRGTAMPPDSRPALMKRRHRWSGTGRRAGEPAGQVDRLRSAVSRDDLRAVPSVRTAARGAVSSNYERGPAWRSPSSNSRGIGGQSGRRPPIGSAWHDRSGEDRSALTNHEVTSRHICRLPYIGPMD